MECSDMNFDHSNTMPLYKLCLRNIAICLRDGVYNSYPKNPFSFLPSKFVNDLMSTALDFQRENGLKADELEQLLTSGKLQELKIHDMEVRQHIIPFLTSLTSGCQELKVLHLVNILPCHNAKKPRSDVAEALGNLFKNTPNLEDLHCCFSFDLRALRNCKKLRSVRLHFKPKQHLCDFLAKQNGFFQPHDYLEFFTVCGFNRVSQLVPKNDIVVILLYCPKVTNLGGIDIFGALLHLHKMGMLLSELKLRYFFWEDSITDSIIPDQRKFLEDENRVRDAMQHYPLIEELYVRTRSVQIVSCLRNFRNLVFLNITLNICSNKREVFREVLQEIGFQLKHLFLNSDKPLDIGSLLQNCPNLESLRISGCHSPDFYYPESASFVQPAISFPKLQHLTLGPNFESYKQFFSLLFGCNRLVELYLIDTPVFADQTIDLFLNKNSLLNLKTAYFNTYDLTKEGLRRFLQNAPELEIIKINKELQLKSLIQEINPKTILNEYLTPSDEFFAKRHNFNICL